MIPLTVVMLDVLGDRPAKMTVAERDHSVEAFVFDRAHEPFGISIRIRRLKRRLHDPDPGLAQPVAHRRAPLRVTITDQHAMADENTLVRSGERVAYLGP